MGIKMYVGVTDRDWFELLKQEKCDEVNFWKPSAKTFKSLQENELFLFKLHSPDDYIVGGGFFVRYTVLPTFLAWSAFGIKNGTRDVSELDTRIKKYRQRSNMPTENPQIGCIILTEPFYFEESDWIPVPADWSKNTVSGKTYDTSTQIGAHLYEQVQERLQKTAVSTQVNAYSISPTKHRLGQGAFRVVVTDAYQRRCSITGEKTLPVLEAAHIKPFSSEGPNTVQNGLLLKSDFHTLYDKGYITIGTDHVVEVSKRLHDDFGNGKDYYKYHGQKLLILPSEPLAMPSQEFLSWHNEHIYLG